MSKPKNVTPDKEKEWLDARRAYMKAWRAANPEKHRDAVKKWRDANPEKQRAAVKARRAANLEKHRAYDNARYAENPERQRAYKKACYHANPEKAIAYKKARRAAAIAMLGAMVQRLTDGYVAKTIGLQKSECPPELIELKRQQLELLRLTRQLTKEIKNAE